MAPAKLNAPESEKFRCVGEMHVLTGNWNVPVAVGYSAQEAPQRRCKDSCEGLARGGAHVVVVTVCDEFTGICATRSYGAQARSRV